MCNTNWTCIRPLSLIRSHVYTYSEMFLCCSGVYCCLVDHKQIISGGGDGYVMVWDTATGEHKQTLSGHKEEVVCTMQSLFHGTAHTNNYNQLLNIGKFDNKKTK